MACGPYDRARALIDGSVRPQGIELDIDVTTDTLTRQQRVVDGEYDAAEFYAGAYIADRPFGNLGLTAIPIFVKRQFRHSYVYVNSDSGITSPSDLAGARIGIQSWFTTTAIWMKGILSDDYGLDLRSVRWVSEFSESYLRPNHHPPWADITPLARGKSLKTMLIADDLDAVITTALWAPFDDPRIGFLFPNYPAIEREYFGRTGRFPIMHLLVARDSVLEESPWVAMSLFNAWVMSKQRAAEWLEWQRVHQMSMWFRGLWEEEQRISGGDPYPWGFRANADEVRVLLRYCVEQGIVTQTLTAEELFHPSTLAT